MFNLAETPDWLTVGPVKEMNLLSGTRSPALRIWMAEHSRG